MPAAVSVRVDLLTPLSSAKNREGDLVRAQAVEPVLVNGQAILPAGTVFEGVVAQSKRAQRPYRSGRMRLSSSSLLLPSGQLAQIVVTPTAGQFVNATRLDAEGEFTGALNRKQALLNLVVAYLAGKIFDDLIEEGAKAALGAAVSGSAATAARYVGLGVGTFVFLMHRGHEGSLASQTELQLTFVREARIRP